MHMLRRTIAKYHATWARRVQELLEAQRFGAWWC